MAKKIDLEIVSPEKMVLKDQIDFIVVPAFEGQIGVLPGHAPLLAQLVEGELKIRKGNEERFFAISGGFAEVRPDGVKIFAETAEMGNEINVERARLAADRAKKDLSTAIAPGDLAKAQAALRRALIRLRVSEGVSKRYRK